jgi:hypothetical protein
MNHFPARRFPVLLLAFAALALLAGCQGFSSSNSVSQNSPQNQAEVLTATPASVNFGNVQLGASQTLSDTVTNTGGTSLTITAASVSTAAFSTSGLNLPLTLPAGQSATFSIVFSPQAGGAANGVIALTNGGSGSPLSIAMSGTGTSSVGVSSGQLNVSPSTINAGNVTVGTSGSQSGILSATGASLVVLSADIDSSEFSISGLSFPLTLSAGQSVNFTVTFTPQSSGAASTSISFVSNATNSPSVAALAGTGIAAPIHTVSLSWNADNSPSVTGYNVYRRAGSSGSYTRINTSLIAATDYIDTSVTDGSTYYYETTAVNSSGEESAPSTAVQAVIPPP